MNEPLAAMTFTITQLGLDLNLGMSYSVIDGLVFLAMETIRYEPNFYRVL